MELELSQVAGEVRRVPHYSVRWAAVFAGLTVGIAAFLLLMLVGMAGGFVALGATGRPSTSAVPVVAGAWSTICMPVAAFVGGYVAARTSGLRRTSDGVLHGVVAWGAAMLVFTMLATSAVGATLGAMIGFTGTGLQPSGHTGAAVIGAAGAPRIPMQGIDARPVQGEPERQPPAAGREPDISVPDGDNPKRAMQAASVASTWLCVAIVLSMLVAMAGGALGVRGTRRLRRVKVKSPAARARTVPETRAESVV